MILGGNEDRGHLINKLMRLIFVYLQLVLSQEALSLQFLDVVTILLKYCGPKSNEKGETQAVIVDLVATLGFFCANNKKNQVILALCTVFLFNKA